MLYNSDIIQIEYEAIRLRNNRYAVRPKGQLGTCGWFPKAWTVIYVNAKNEQDALKKTKLDK